MRQRRSSGFTLVEVLVALAIIAIALGAAVKATGSLIRNNEDLRIRSLALMSAENRIAEIRMQRQFPDPGLVSSPCPQGRFDLVCDAEIKPTPNPGFRRVEIRVYEAGNHSHQLAGLIGIVPNNL